MNVLYFGMDAVNYGSRSHEVLVAEEMARIGHKVFLCVEKMPHYEEGEKPENLFIEVVPVNEKKLRYDIIEKIKGFDYDVVFASSISGVVHANYFAKTKGVKSVCQILDVPMFRLKYSHWQQEWLEHITELQKCDIIITNTQTTKDNLLSISESKINEKLIKIVYYGVATKNADEVPEQKRENQIVFVGSLRFYKGLDLLIYALACLENPPILKVIGIEEQGLEKSVMTQTGAIPFRLIEIANFCGVKVEFLGGVDDRTKFETIKKSKLGVYCDMNDAITGMFPLEAVFCEIPCLVGDMLINRERFSDCVEYVKRRFDTGAWAQEIMNVLDNYDVYKKRAVEGKKWVLANRSFRSHASQVLRVIEECSKKVLE